jgi:flagellar motor switch protein FliM
VGTAFTQTWQRARREPTPADRRALLDHLSRVRLSVAATLDTTLRARELLALRPGDVLSLGQAADDVLDIRVQGTRKFTGRLVARGRAAGVRLERAEPAPASEA